MDVNRFPMLYCLCAFEILDNKTVSMIPINSHVVSMRTKSVRSNGENCCDRVRTEVVFSHCSCRPFLKWTVRSLNFWRKST